MTLPRTARGLTHDVQEAARRIVRRALEDLSSIRAIAAALGLDESRVRRWLDTDAAHAPLYLLAHPALPEALRLRLVADLLAAVAPRGPRTSVETATHVLLAAAGECVQIAARALCDGRIDDAERADLRPVVARVRGWCDRWLAEHGEVTPLRAVGGGDG